MGPDQITIAVTVFNRRQFLKQAVGSAVNQSVPVRVVVVEDCGPDPTLESFVKSAFGSRIEYIRNPRRRGLFGNWNACMDVCATEWLSILHDDDYLAPGFIEAMMELSSHAPGPALYFGQTVIVDEQGQPTDENPLRPVQGPWQRIGLQDILYLTPFPFPGQLFKTSAAKEAGGFRETSYFCGDWEMWGQLIAREGSAQTAKVVAYKRGHDLWDKGTNAVVRSGRHLPTSFIQQKRVLALLPAHSKITFDRAAYHSWNPLSVRFLLRYGASLRPRLLAYHVRLLLLSRPPHWRYALFQQCVRIAGVGFVKRASVVWNRLSNSKKEQP
jgi:glycosyltransferase involved in cell wall biosynthesis